MFEITRSLEIETKRENGAGWKILISNDRAVELMCAWICPMLTSKLRELHKR